MKSSKTTKIFLSVLAIAATLVGILVVSSGDSTYAAPRSYPMTCKGGGRLTIANDGNNGVWITFEAGKGSAYDGLEPGQCSWWDRPLRDGEPRVICDEDNKRASQYVGKLVRSDETVTVQVYSYEGRCMRVTKIGPWARDSNNKQNITCDTPGVLRATGVSLPFWNPADVNPGDVFSYLITATNLFDSAVFFKIFDELNEAAWSLRPHVAKTEAVKRRLPESDRLRESLIRKNYNGLKNTTD